MRPTFGRRVGSVKNGSRIETNSWARKRPKRRGSGRDPWEPIEGNKGRVV